MEDRKANRKRKKFAARLKKAKDIICLDTPTPNIVLCNVGQATGLQREILLKTIKNILPAIALPKVIAEKGESHSFLAFHNRDDATVFYNMSNGLLKIDENSPPTYMIYVDKIPDTEVLCCNNNPKGLYVFPDFISHAEELKFIQHFDWTENQDTSNLKNRRVKHYGYEFRYGNNDVDLNDPLVEKIPQICELLWTRLKDCGINCEVPPDQLTVNKYFPGQGIPSHVDKHSPFGSTILSLSLGSSVVMDWRHHSGKYVPVLVPARSMLAMTDEARYDWQHGIQPRTWDPVIEHRQYTDSEGNISDVRVVTNESTQRQVRISLTFRWTRSGPCECFYKTLCDSVDRSTTDIEDSLATELEERHVHQVYDQIAGHFSTTRHKPWPKVVHFMEGVTPGSVILDLGCGNGKNILRRGDVLQVAGERSSGLLAECKSHVRHVAAADCVRLDLLHAPLRDTCADLVLCIAVIHHFSSKHRRIQAISTIARLLRPGGKALITVWAKDQTNSNYLKSSEVLKSKDEQLHTTIGGLNLPIHENRTQFKHNDLLVPWKLRNLQEKKLAFKSESTLLRYYHVFEENELDRLCSEVNNLEVVDSFYEEGNWCVICKKI